MTEVQSFAATPQSRPGSFPLGIIDFGVNIYGPRGGHEMYLHSLIIDHMFKPLLMEITSVASGANEIPVE
jgi:hypothetical protein